MKESGKEAGGQRTAIFKSKLKEPLNSTKRSARSPVACVPPTSNSQEDHPTPGKNAHTVSLLLLILLPGTPSRNTHRKNHPFFLMKTKIFLLKMPNSVQNHFSP